MKYIVRIRENEDPDGVRFWATVDGLDGCLIAEETIDALIRNAPGIIRDVIETSNARGSSFALPTEFEFSMSVAA